MKFQKIFIYFIILILFASCGKNQEAANPKEKADNQQKSVKTVPVEAMIVKKQTIEQNVPLTGIFKPIRSVDIVSEVSGKVVKVYHKLGDKVTTTDTLAQIDDKIALAN